MRKEVPVTDGIAGSGRIEDGKVAVKIEDTLTVKKAVRAWKPAEFKVSGERETSCADQCVRVCVLVFSDELHRIEISLFVLCILHMPFHSCRTAYKIMQQCSRSSPSLRSLPSSAPQL